MREHWKSAVIQFAIFCFLSGGLTHGQSPQKKVLLLGAVYDQTGAPCPDAKIVAVGEKDESFETKTRADGSYELSLPVVSFKGGGDVYSRRISIYSIKASLAGFRITEVKGLKLVSPKTGKLRLDFVLEVGLLGN